MDIGVLKIHMEAKIMTTRLIVFATAKLTGLMRFNNRNPIYREEIRSEERRGEKDLILKIERESRDENIGHQDSNRFG
jgi:hypothetical protein